MKRIIGLSLVLLLVISAFSLTLFAQQNILRVGGSSTVHPIANLAAAYWNANSPANSEYWPASKYGINTDKNLADYWASLYGLEKFRVQIDLSNSGWGLKNISEGIKDIGNSSTVVKFEYPKKSEEELSGYTPHKIAYDHQAFSVSKEVYEAGCHVLTKEEIAGIFKGEITNWSQVNSCDYDKEIQAVGRVVGSGTETMFRVNVFGSAKVSNLDADIRKGQNQMVKQVLVICDNAIGYPGIDFISKGNPAIKVIWDDGKTYSVEDQDWPLKRSLYMYTWKGTSKQEAAFIRMILSDFGQSVIVEKNTGYYKLSESDQAEELEKLYRRIFMEKPENPIDGAVYVDEFGVVHEWKEEGSKWIIQAYKFKDEEKKALIGILGFYASLLSDMPDDVTEEFEEVHNIDIKTSIETAEYFLRKFNNE